MLDPGDTAPAFTVAAATPDDEIVDVTLGDHLGGGPLVLVFFPGAYSSTCTTELRAFADRTDELRALGATVLGVSVDSPFVLRAFRAEHELPFTLLSDFDREVIQAYDVTTTLDGVRMSDVAARAVVVVDGSGVVTWRWRGDPDEEPDYGAVLGAAGEAA